jgi:hypothetical protein
MKIDFSAIDRWVLDSANQASARKPKRNAFTYIGKTLVAIPLFMALTFLPVRYGIGQTTHWDYICSVSFVIGVGLWWLGERRKD